VRFPVRRRAQVEGAIQFEVYSLLWWQRRSSGLYRQAPASVAREWQGVPSKPRHNRRSKCLPRWRCYSLKSGQYPAMPLYVTWTVMGVSKLGTLCLPYELRCPYLRYLVAHRAKRLFRVSAVLIPRQGVVSQRPCITNVARGTASLARPRPGATTWHRRPSRRPLI